VSRLGGAQAGDEGRRRRGGTGVAQRRGEEGGGEVGLG